MTDFFDKVKNILIPEGLTCPFCYHEIEEGRKVCSKCLSKLIFIREKACIKCGREVFRQDKICTLCKNKEHAFDKGYSVFTYDELVALAIHRLKYNEERGLCKFFAEFLVDKAKTLTESIDFVSFVPMTLSAEKRRGFNQSEVLAEFVAKALNKQLFSEVFKVRETKKQRELDSKKRAKNLVDAFMVKEKLTGKNVLLVDDVLTTGATMDNLAKAFKKSGAENVYFITLASTALNE